MNAFAIRMGIPEMEDYWNDLSGRASTNRRPRPLRRAVSSGSTDRPVATLRLSGSNPIRKTRRVALMIAFPCPDFPCGDAAAGTSAATLNTSPGGVRRPGERICLGLCKGPFFDYHAASTFWNGPANMRRQLTFLSSFGQERPH
jgi:hypothetical protein